MQSLLTWVSLHSEYAEIAVFLVSTIESFAVLGILVPGMLFMLGIGTLIGIGSLDFWPMFVAATLGAITGDGLSFWLGRHFNRNLRHVWPLPKFPGLLQKGEAFFHRHGAMSVLFGRFVGPLRAIIPAVAGMLQMQPRRFLLFNVISAIAWAPVVLLPGALLGASLGQVSAVAMRFGLLVFFIALAFWCIGWFVNHGLVQMGLVRSPLNRHAQLWRIGVHSIVYVLLLLTAFFYRLQLPQFPVAADLNQIAKLDQAKTVSRQALMKMGYGAVWLGSTQALQHGLLQDGWRESAHWNMTTALAWMADKNDLSQLVFSDPRLAFYHFPWHQQAWIKVQNQRQVLVLQVWTETDPTVPEPISLLTVKQYTLQQAPMGYRYFHEIRLETPEMQKVFAALLPFQAPWASNVQRIEAGKDAASIWLRKSPSD